MVTVVDVSVLRVKTIIVVISRQRVTCSRDKSPVKRWHVYDGCNQYKNTLTLLKSSCNKSAKPATAATDRKKDKYK